MDFWTGRWDAAVEMLRMWKSLGMRSVLEARSTLRGRKRQPGFFRDLVEIWALLRCS